MYLNAVFMTVMYLAAKSAMDKTEPVRLHFKTAINMSVMYMISVYLTAVCMTSVYMKALYVSGISAYIRQYVLDVNFQVRNEDVCNTYDCSVCFCSIQDLSVYNCMYMPAVFMNVVF